jgi:RNA polymerase sigma-70 factor (ECF subfamily)
MAETDVTDEELVRRCVDGDEGAGRLLLDRLFLVLPPRLRLRMGPALRRKVGESDLVQTTSAAVFAHLRDFRDGGPGSFRRWAEGILENRLIDELRRYQGTRKRDSARERDVDALSERSIPKVRDASPSGAASLVEDRRRIRAALDLLSPDHRRVVALLHERGLSLSSAATAMERSPEAVRKLYSRAIERLTEILGLEGHV